MKKVALATLLVAVAYGGWRWQRAAPADQPKADLAFNRFWIDHLPTDERDPVQIFVVNRPESIGAFVEETMWRGQLEKFRFEAAGGELRVLYPWSGDRETVTVEARRCDEAGMDYCLELHGSQHGVARYYSRVGWERRDLDDVAAFRRELDAK